MRLRELRVRRFRNVLPGTTVHFDDDWNILLGKNGSGKTTLLNLITCGLSSDFTALSNDDIDLDYTLHSDLGTLVVHVCSESNVVPRETLDAVPTDIPRRVLRVRATVATFSPPTSSHVDGVTGESPTVNGKPSSRPLPLHEESLFIDLVSHAMWSTDSARESPLRQFYEDLLGARNLSRLDEGLESFRALLADDRTRVTTMEDTDGKMIGVRHTKHLLTRIGSLLFHQSRTSDVVAPSLADSELDFLRRARSLFGFQSAEMQLALREKKVFDPPDGARSRRAIRSQSEYGPFVFRFHRRNGSIVSHDLLSFGQKRLLTFLYYAESNTTAIVADELVNGLHHEWIEHCVNAMRGRQKFLTSQNPLLLDYLGFENATEVANRFIRCEQNDDTLIWRNLNADDARRFYEAYRVGIQHVGEILRMKGLW